MKRYIQEFFWNEGGIETIEFLGMVIVAVALVVVITNVARRIRVRADRSTNDAMEDMQYNHIKGIVEDAG